MRTIEMDGGEMKTKLSAHCYIKKAMEFPEYYGENLDALWDLLSTISLPTTIRLDHRETLIENLGTYGERLIEVFREAALENDSLWIEIQ
jgi:ribonuclease inhibitor